MQKTRISPLFFIIALLLPVTVSFAPPQMGMPQMPGMGGPQFGGPQFGPAATPMGPGAAPGGFPVPSEEDFARAMREIEMMSPEEIAAAERMGQMIIANMNDEEFAQIAPMFEAMQLNPAEVREEARRAIAEFEAGMQAPAAFEEPIIQPSTPAPLPAAKEVEQPKPSKVAVTQTKDIVKGLIALLGILQQKSSSVREIHEEVRALLQELRDLMYYLRVMDKHQYHEHLSLPQFKHLLQTLNTLLGEFRTEMPNLALPDDLIEDNNPYDILGVKMSASQDAIDAAYEKLAAQHDTKKLEAQLKAENYAEKDIQRQVKSARIILDTIDDAYELLKEPKVRTQLDRDIKTRKQVRKQKIETAHRALKNINEALVYAIYNNELLRELEEFLRTYGPKQLALKKEMDDAEKKRLEEQKALSKVTPSKTTGSFEPTISYQAPSYDYGYGGDFNPYSYGDYGYPDFSYGSPYADYDDYSKPSGAPAEEKSAATGDKEKKEKEDKEKKDKEEKDKTTKEKEKEDLAKKRKERADKIDKRAPEEIMDAIAKNLDAFAKEYKAKNPKTLLDNFELYLKKEKDKTLQKEEKDIHSLLKDLEKLPVPDLDMVKKNKNDPSVATDIKNFDDKKAAITTSLDAYKKRANADSTWAQKVGNYVDSKNVDAPQPQKKDLKPSKFAPVEATWSNSLEQLYKDLKLNVLLKDASNLLEKLSILKVTEPTKKQIDAWDAVEAKLGTVKTSFDDMSKKLGQIKAMMPVESSSEKNVAHGSIIDTGKDYAYDIPAKLNTITQVYF